MIVITLRTNLLAETASKGFLMRIKNDFFSGMRLCRNFRPTLVMLFLLPYFDANTSDIMTFCLFLFLMILFLLFCFFRFSPSLVVNKFC